MRLIDADKLMKDIYSNAYACTNDEINEILCKQLEANINVINNQPTAYDVDKVVEQLEKLRDKANLDMLKNMNEPIPYSSTSNRMFAYDKAIEVVKAGGTNDN